MGTYHSKHEKLLSFNDFVNTLPGEYYYNCILTTCNFFRVCHPVKSVLKKSDKSASLSNYKVLIKWTDLGIWLWKHDSTFFYIINYIFKLVVETMSGVKMSML